MTKIIVIIFMVFNKVIAQEIPQESFKFKFQELLFDIAENWEGAKERRIWE